MNYELKKQLKDAGFPQHYTREDNEVWILNGKDLVHDVTLSELIEACPQTKQVDGGLIYYLTLWAEPHEWQIAYCPAWKEEMYLGMMGRGTSPVEAVAKLWLALHNPK